MHKKFYNFMLPVLGAAVVVGSGFSAWVFNNISVTPATANGTVVVAPGAEAKSLVVSSTVETFTINLVDANSIVFKNGDAEFTQIDFNWTLTMAFDDDYNETLEQNILIKHTIKVELAENDYLKCTYSDGAIEKDLTLTTTASAASESVVYTGKSTLTTAAIGLQFKDDGIGKPTTFDELSAMRSALSSVTMTITESYVADSIVIPDAD